MQHADDLDEAGTRRAIEDHVHRVADRRLAAFASLAFRYLPARTISSTKASFSTLRSTVRIGMRTYRKHDT
jgi:hypothetical protein